MADVVLLPKGVLPLNIFEPRYIAMIDHALKHDRLIGMIQPRSNAESFDKLGLAPSTLYNIGCVGRITNFNETPDGRYEIMLSGLNRFEITDSALTADGFYNAHVAWNNFTYDMDKDHGFKLDRDSLNQLLKRYFACHQLNACWETMKETPNHMLITALAMICPFTAQEKQALLEAPTCKDRAKYLTKMLEISVAENGCSEQSSSCC